MEEQNQKFEPMEPEVRVTYSKSKTGRSLIVRTTITDIKPLSYFAKILESPQE